MKNEKIVINETGEEIKIEIVLSFRLEEHNKEYVAYTINDDDSMETALVFISEIDVETNKLKSIDENDKETVLIAYEELKRELFNE